MVQYRVDRWCRGIALFNISFAGLADDWIYSEPGKTLPALSKVIGHVIVESVIEALISVAGLTDIENFEVFVVQSVDATLVSEVDWVFLYPLAPEQFPLVAFTGASPGDPVGVPE
ncbi:hypothetical protein CAP40_17955 [Sphingomonas sp. IBVSS2]|nr:hypothetical protein CAP40_17955 [Sphingomonas sp. IBVSS2]